MCIICTPWYDTNWFSDIIGATISIFTFCIGNHINNKVQKESDIKNLIILITQTNQELFSLIYLGANNEEKIDYLKIRNELKKSSAIYLMPKKLKKPFMELYGIYFTDPKYYDINRINIHKILKEIVDIINKYERYLE